MTSQAVLDTPPQSVNAFPAGIDPVRFEVLRNALLAITEEMGATLRRAAYSTNIKTRGDFSCAFFDRELRTIAQAFAQPSHLGSLAHIVPRAIRTYGAERLAPGDGILINDPYAGGVRRVSRRPLCRRDADGRRRRHRRAGEADRRGDDRERARVGRPHRLRRPAPLANQRHVVPGVLGCGVRAQVPDRSRYPR